MAGPGSARPARLADIAPRLAKARDARLADERKDRALRRYLRDQILSDERALAHRELQLQRAFARPGKDRGYVTERARKVGTLRQMLADRQRRLADLEARALHNDPGMDHWINRPRLHRSLRP